ncbi:MAG: hypothetical protein GKR89_23225 [Candidatus Latescibacteria bacterium]|nr:hypothetical protein [Candidatus Latescibacterota bacterium]
MTKEFIIKPRINAEQEALLGRLKATFDRLVECLYCIESVVIENPRSYIKPEVMIRRVQSRPVG